MAKVLVDESCFSGIADAIREKTSSTATYKPREMADAISKIQGGGKTKFGVSIDNCIGDVNADGTLSAPGPVDVVLEGVKKVPRDSLRGFFYARSISMPDLVSVGDNGFCAAFANAPNLESISFPSLETASGYQAFYQVGYHSERLSSVSFPKLKRVVGGYAFYAAFAYSAVTKFEFPSLEIIDCDDKNSASGSQFYFALTPSYGKEKATASFPKLTTIYANGAAYASVFGNSRNLARIDFPALTTLGTHYTGSGTASLDAVKNMFASCYDLKEIHFGAANQAAVEAMPGYDTLWGLGAGNATVYFDL